MEGTLQNFGETQNSGTPVEEPGFKVYVIFGLKLQLVIPRHVRIGHVAEFKCIYELGEHELYAVKWYKNKDEFYRFVPKDNPPGQVFQTPGVTVNLTLSNDTVLVLENVQLATSGVYGCEVSEEAPSFQTETKSGEMMVIDPPQRNQTLSIIGAKLKYRVEDMVNVNCTAPKSSPPATLEWVVNEEKADETVLLHYAPTRYPDGKASSTLGLKFQVKDVHFLNGGITLKCTGSVEPFYRQITQKTIVGDHPTAAVLESRGGYNEVRTGNNARRLELVHSLIFLLPALPLCFLFPDSPSLLSLLIR